jgi:hypothetical protein
MRKRCISDIGIPPVDPITEISICKVSLDHRALSPVGVVKVPTPECLHQLEGARCIADGETAEQLEGGDEG